MKQLFLILICSLLGWSCSTTPMQTAWTPFEFKKQKIVIPASIKGQPIKVLFDSGAGMNAIDEKLADKLRLKASERHFVHSLADVKPREFASRVPFDFYGAEIHLDVAFEDLSSSGVDAVFGAELLRGVVMEFDFPRERVRFHRLGAYRYAGPTKAIKLRQMGERYFVDLTVNGEESRFLVDTGATGSLMLPLSAERLQEKFASGGKEVLLRGVHGEKVRSAEETAKPFQLGSYEIKDAKVRYYDPKRGDTLEGILGMTLLKEFNVIFDSYHDAMYIESYE